MTKQKTPDELSDSQLEDAQGGRLVGAGSTVVEELSIDAAANAGLRISVNTPPGPNGGATTNQAPVQTTEFIGGPPALTKARHCPMMSTIRNTM